MLERRIHFETIGSTNTWAKEHLNEFDPELVSLITAGMQTAGRGRFTRRWESPPQENVYATFVFFLNPERESAVLGNIPQVLAISAVRCVRRRQLQAYLKWPNDILLDGKKLGGLLCETQFTPDGLGVVLGIGLNVNMRLEILEAIDQPATSLWAASGRDWDLIPLIQELDSEFCRELTRCRRDGFAPFYEEFKDLAAMDPNRILRVQDGAESLSGTFHAIDESGALLLRLEDGTIRRCVAGEILP